MVQIFVAENFDVAGKPKDPERDLSALSTAARAKAIKVMGQLGKLGDETFPARIVEYVGLRSKYSVLTVQPDGARKEKLRMLGAYAPPGSAPFDLVMEFLVGPPKIVKGDLKELKIILLFFLSTNEKHIEKPSIN